MPVLVVAEHDNKKLKPFTLNAVTAASQMDADLHVLVIGHNSSGVVKEVSEISEVKKVLHTESEHYENFIAENFTSVIVKLLEVESVTSVSEICAVAELLKRRY